MNAVWPHLPILQVILPLFGGFCAAFLRNGRAAFAVALAVCCILPIISGAMLWQVLTTGPLSYHLGGWEPPWGIEPVLTVDDVGVVVRCPGCHGNLLSLSLGSRASMTWVVPRSQVRSTGQAAARRRLMP